MNASEWIQLGFQVAGMIAVIYALASLHERFFGDGVAKPAPKPRPYRVMIEDPDGWPFRSFDVPVKEAGRVIRDLDRLKDG